MITIDHIWGFVAAVPFCFLFHNIVNGNDDWDIVYRVKNFFKKKTDSTKCLCHYPMSQKNPILMGYCGECGRKC